MGQIKAKIGLTAPKIALFLAVGDRGRFEPRQPLVYQLKALPFAWFSYHYKDSSTWFLFPTKDRRICIFSEIDFRTCHLVAEACNKWLKGIFLSIGCHIG